MNLINMTVSFSSGEAFMDNAEGRVHVVRHS